MKLNTKLSNSINEGSVWRVIPEGPNRSPPGVMLMGYTMTSEAGQSGIMVVSGTCALESNNVRFGHSIQVQTKAPLVAPRLLKSMMQVCLNLPPSPLVPGLDPQLSRLVNCCISQSLIGHYALDRCEEPSRIIVYRNGGNDSQFEGTWHMHDRTTFGLFLTAPTLCRDRENRSRSSKRSNGRQVPKSNFCCCTNSSQLSSGS